LTTTRCVEPQLTDSTDHQDWEVIAKKEHLDHIGVELRKFEEVVKEIHREMRAIRKRDLENQTVKGILLPAPLICE